MGSSWFTITLNPSVGFTRYDENNEELMKIRDKYPERFEVWPTISPDDPGSSRNSRPWWRGGRRAQAVPRHGYVNPKTGAYLFHTMALDDPRMLPLYSIGEENFIPVCLHVQLNGTWAWICRGVRVGAHAVPEHEGDMPHYMLSSILQPRLREFLDTFRTCIAILGSATTSPRRDSNGSRSRRQVSPALRGLSQPVHVATDLVVTNYALKNQQWVQDRLKSYLDMLTQETYTTPALPGETLNGWLCRRRLWSGSCAGTSMRSWL